MSRVLVLGTETATEWIGAGVVLGILAALIGFLIRRRALRAEARTGSWAGDGLALVPGGVVGVLLAMLGRTGAFLCFGVVAVVWASLLRKQRRGGPAPAASPPPPRIEELPPEYRFQDGPRGMIAGCLVPMAIILASAVAFDGELAAQITLGVALLAAIGGLTIVYGRRRRRQREIIESVERRADGLPRDDLRKLVELLELEHGRFEMRRLRRLVGLVPLFERFGRS
jgi:hypothetical protein